MIHANVAGEWMRGDDRALINHVYEAAVIPERWLKVLEQISGFAGSDGAP